MFKKCITLILLTVTLFGAKAQEKDIAYRIGEKYPDKHRYSNLLAIADDDNGGTVVVRSYFAGVVLRPKGYLIEHYNEDLELLSEHNYKLKNSNFVEAYVKNGQVYLLFLEYNHTTLAYEYIVHRSPFTGNTFTKEVLLSIPSEMVQQPLDRNYYNRNFSKGFTTSVLFNKDKTAFAITTHFKRRKENKHFIYVFDASLRKLIEHDFSDEVAEKNYAFENIVFSEDLSNVYLVGKAYFKKKRFNATERKFQYELVRISSSGGATQSFYTPGKFPEALKPIFKGKELLCIGFYADRKDNRYNGISYFKLNPISLQIEAQKFFFISTSSESPQQISAERIMFKQGLSRNKNLFLIRLNEQGHMSYEKAIDDIDARLPLMVSKPLIDNSDHTLLFYAKRGNKKQLVRVGVQ